MVTGLNPGLTELDTMVSIKTERKTEKGTLLLLTGASTQDSLKRMKFLDRASTHGQTAKYMKVNGPKTKCTVLANLCGRTVKSTKESLEMTNEKVMEYFIGETAESTMVSGVTASSMERASS
jgi:hypothetical protein